MVENYFNTELIDIVFEEEHLDEWKSLVQELGIEGQQKVIEGESKSPIPFPYMNESMRRVYTTLCPNKELYSRYDKTPIPLEVLKQMKLCKNDNYFKKMEIWSDTKSPDPLVVGITYDWYSFDLKDENGNHILFSKKTDCIKHPDNKSNTAYQKDVKHYLVARWGDELRDYKELKKMAIERKIEEVANVVSKQYKEAEQKLKLIKENVTSYIGGEMSEYDLKVH